MLEITPPYIKINLLTYETTKLQEFGRKLFELLWESDHLLVPETFGFHSKAEKHFYTNTEDMVSFWPKDTRYWHNSKALKHDGLMYHKFQSHGGLNPGRFTLHAAYSSDIDWQNKFEKLCSLFKPTFAMMHLYTDFECRTENSTPDFRNASFGTGGSPTVPGLGWMFATKRRHIRVWDLDGLDIKRTDCGRYTLLQLAKSDDEILNDFEAFQARRNALVSRLNAAIPNMKPKPGEFRKFLDVPMFKGPMWTQ